MDNPQIWWSDGLHFACLGCGRCCRGEPGAIWVSEEEEIIIAAWLNLSVEVFRNSYETRRWGPLSLKEKCGGDCIFYNREGARCSIYPVRPSQCSLFPFWPSILATKESWDRAATLCPGMNEGHLFTASEIESLLRQFPASIPSL
ncbi:YkgJ family cysteine cluster protein [Aminobacterium colombiense]|jgi:Fe-S-cluster containining protein|uniref:YkgJ family cysteine cluster protein n=1 Tax=Aminobacterium colombiense TaxID=81468 RepID=UPI001BCCEEEA